MNPNYLDFEQPIAELEAKIRELRNVGSGVSMNLEEEIQRLEQKCRDRTETIFSELSDWQISQLARHPQRPYTLDYVPMVFDRFEELHGDRHFADDHAIVGGPA
ncbi:MAG TPA: acetyl-CoA carboxylase carboxyl transferase subunit alpha, partial [Wenzhouxiangella sp.]|nr:acetyl-CoA carboxylase carboxyl transferase subunit alpha [Wenzhouxiangella sp.]